LSRIIHSLNCKHCNVTVDCLYISFGHPDESFDWKWRCEECNEVNVEIIQAMPNGKERDSGISLIHNEQTDKLVELLLKDTNK